MNGLQIASTGWTAFWSTVTQPWFLGLLMMIVVASLLISFAFRQTMRGLMWALRVLSALTGTLLVISFLNNLGLPVVEDLRWLINMALTAMQAPILL